jgi:putative transposase
LKEKGYIPSNSDSSKIVSGYITSKSGRYFVSVNVDSDNDNINKKTNKIKHLGEPIGIDLGVSHFAVLSDGRVYENINYGKNIKSVNKQINKLQNSLRRKRLQNKSSRNHDFKGMNFDKNVRALSKQYKRIDDIRDDFINKVIADILSTDPEYIAIEDLIVKEMVKDRTFSRSVSDQTFREFRNRLQKKCVRLGIELRVINRWYPSSKKCHNCGKVKKELQINERIYKCDCGYVADRDYNASLNIRDSKDYYIFKLRST